MLNVETAHRKDFMPKAIKFFVVLCSLQASLAKLTRGSPSPSTTSVHRKMSQVCLYLDVFHQSYLQLFDQRKKNVASVDSKGKDVSESYCTNPLRSFRYA